MQCDIAMHYPPRFHERALEFFQYYELVNSISCPEKKVGGLKLKHERVCRFCQRKYGETTFKSKAHVLSEFIGNRYLISDFECDQCNQIFKKYESDLANYIGPTRAFQELHQTGNTIKFKSPNHEVITETTDFYGAENCVSVSRQNYLDQTFEIDQVTGVTKIKFVKQSYAPLRVYKAVLKMALSCLNTEEIAKYKLAIDYMMSDSLNNRFRGLKQILKYSLPPATGGVNSPVVFLFKKKQESHKIITHVFMLYFMNYIYEMAIPLHSDDLIFYNQIINDLFCPPLFASQADASSAFLKAELIDFSSDGLLKGEEEIFSFRYSPEDLKNSMAYDPATKQIKKSNGNTGEIMRMMFVKKGTNIHFPK